MRLLLALTSVSSVALGACGGGVPLLHPAHVLPAGRTSFGAGVSDRFVLGSERSALDFARERAIDNAPPPSDPRYTRGVLVALAEGPALAPWASARVGISGSNEVGLSFTGPAVRADARHAFDWGATAFSAGLGLTARGLGHSALDLPDTDLNRVTGFGVDVPLLLGYRTDADLVSVWAGLRGAYDHWSGTVELEPEPDADSSLSAARLSAGPVVGLAVGVAPIYVAAELELDYSHVTGTLDQPAQHDAATINGWSLRPAGALIGKF